MAEPLTAEGAVTVFSGGGTGGHLYPALALAEALARVRPDVRPFFVGAERGLEARVLPERELPHALLPVRPFHRGRLAANWRVVPALVRALAAVARLFARLRPRLVVVTGGYAGAPAGLWAVVKRIPLALQEQNSVPGLTTRWLARWARQIHLAFPEAGDRLPASARSRAEVSGNPIRPLETVPRREARARFGLDDAGTVALVVGGSQGAEAVNRAVAGAVEGVARGDVRRPPGLHLLWAAGPDHARDATRRVAGADAASWVHVRGYIDDMPGALAAADVAVSRAGAMATAELLAAGVPMVLVPLPSSAGGHQAANARALEEAGAAIHLPEGDLDSRTLWSRLGELVEDRGRREEMARKARERGRPDAADHIAGRLAELLPGGRP